MKRRREKKKMKYMMKNNPKKIQKNIKSRISEIRKKYINLKKKKPHGRSVG